MSCNSVICGICKITGIQHPSINNIEAYAENFFLISDKNKKQALKIDDIK